MKPIRLNMTVGEYLDDFWNDIRSMPIWAALVIIGVVWLIDYLGF